MTTQAKKQWSRYRAFIYGVEVTSDLSDISWTRTDQRQPGTATLVLANNALSRYVISDEDIITLYKPTSQPVNLGIPDFYTGIGLDADSSSASLQVATLGAAGLSALRLQSLRSATARETAFALDTLKAQALDRVSRYISDPIKARVLASKAYEASEVQAPAIGATGTFSTLTDLEKIRGIARRFPYQVGDCLFHSSDAVRIFGLDPDDQNTWHFVFAGFVTDTEESVDGAGNSRVSIVCEGPTRALRYARIAFNPGIFDIASLAQQEDAVVRTFFQEGLTALNLPEFMFTVLFGAESAGTIDRIRSYSGQSTASVIRGVNSVPFLRYGANAAPTLSSAGQTGAGSFNLEGSCIWVYGPNSGVSTAGAANDFSSALTAREVPVAGEFALQAYQNFIDSAVRLDDPTRMRLPGTGEAPVLSSVDAVIEEIGQYPQYYPVDYGRLVMLVPGSLGAGVSRSVLLSDLVQNVATQTTFRTRLDMIYDVCQRIEFSFYESPRGDLLCEMPLYDFDPDDFGDGVSRPDGPASVFAQAVTAGRSQSTDATNTFGVDLRSGPYAQGIALAIQQGADAMSRPYSEDFFAAKNSTTSYARRFSDETVRTQFASPWYVVGGRTDVGDSNNIGQAPQVVTRRGLVPQYGVRFEQAEPHAFIGNKEAAAVYCELKLNQWNANARTVTLQMTPRLRWQPNRPVIIQQRSAIATIRQVQFTSSQSGVSMVPTLNYLRGWDGTVNEQNQPIYLPLGGALSTALNYAALLGSKRNPTPSVNKRPEPPSESVPPEGSE